MATQNLYEVQDVSATLLFAIASKDTMRVQQAYAELISSGCTTLANQCLILGWLLSPPVHTSNTIYNALNSKEPTALLQAVLTLGPYELPPPPQPPPPPPTDLPTTYVATMPLPKTWSKTAQARFELALKYAMKTKHVAHAAYLTSGLPQTAVTVLLTHLGLTKSFTNLYETTEQLLKHRVLLHGFAVLTQPAMLPVKLPTLKTVTGRCLTIPSLAYATWNVTPQPPSRLVGLPYQILDATATPFWKTVVTEYKITRKDAEFQFPDDAMLELFYATYFPNDIPDEWSSEERRKSHPCPKIMPLDNPWIPAFLRLG